MITDKSLSYKGKKVWITGSTGMLGSALVRCFADEGAVLLTPTSKELDLRDQDKVLKWAEENRPEFVFHAGAKVGGIFANTTYRADFMYDNLMIQTNVLYASHRFNVKKLIFVASNCTYPTQALQPIQEEMLLTGALEENVRAYAVAKIAGIEMCRAYNKQYGTNFISVIPPNLYGPGDNYHPENSHVVAGIIRRAHEAKVLQKELVVWGDGTARRELLHVDDLASAMKYLMSHDVSEDLFNVGCGKDYTINEIVQLISNAVGFHGDIVYDKSKPNGTMQKLLDSTRIKSLGWRPRVEEQTGLKEAYQDFLARKISDK